MTSLRRMYNSTKKNKEDSEFVFTEDFEGFKMEVRGRMSSLQTELEEYATKVAFEKAEVAVSAADIAAEKAEADIEKLTAQLRKSKAEAVAEQQLMHDNLNSLQESLSAALSDSLEVLKAEMVAAFALESGRVERTLRTELADEITTLTSATQGQALELIERLEDQRLRLEQRIELSVQEAIADSQDAKEIAKRTVCTLDSQVAHMHGEVQNMTKQVLIELRRDLDNLEEMLGALKKDFDGSLRGEHETVEASVAHLRGITESHLAKLDVEAGDLREAVTDAMSITTRKVEWTVPDAYQRLQTSRTRSWFSPSFAACGEQGLRLELHVVRLAPAVRDSPASDSPGTCPNCGNTFLDDSSFCRKCGNKRNDEINVGHESGDCVLSLWAAKGVKLTFRFLMGTVASPVMEYESDGLAPSKSRRLWFLDDRLNPDDGSLRIGLEILDASRAVPAGPTQASKDDIPDPNLNQPTVGALVLCRQVNNKMPEVVDRSVALLRSHMIRRVDWKLEQASTLRSCYPEGRCICSLPFVASGVESLHLVFYPSGVVGARPGYCSVFLSRPAVGNPGVLRAWLRLGKQRWEAVPDPDRAELHGRANFCRFDACPDPSDDSLLLVLEVQEAPQDVLEIGAQQDPWRSKAICPKAPTRPAGTQSSAPFSNRARQRVANSGTPVGAASNAASARGSPRHADSGASPTSGSPAPTRGGETENAATPSQSGGRAESRPARSRSKTIPLPEEAPAGSGEKAPAGAARTCATSSSSPGRVEAETVHPRVVVA